MSSGTTLSRCSFLVSSLLTDSTQQIHSLRASGVISSQSERAFGDAVRFFFKSAGNLCTVPPEISCVDFMYLHTTTFVLLDSVFPHSHLVTYSNMSLYKFDIYLKHVIIKKDGLWRPTKQMSEWETRLSTSLLEKRREVVVRVGSYELTRQDMIEKLRCGNFRAGKILSEAIRPMKAQDVQELANRLTTQTFFDLKGVGETAFFVWLCLLEYAKVDVNAWLQSGQEKFATICTRVKKEKKLATRRRRQFRIAS